MRIIDCIRPDRQTVMFSATFPRQMEALARRILDKPVEIQVGGRSVVCSDVDQNVVIDCLFLMQGDYRFGCLKINQFLFSSRLLLRRRINSLSY